MATVNQLRPGILRQDPEKTVTGHLLYIDITQVCGIGCSFCMYADKHSGGAHLVLSDRARENIGALANDAAVKRVSVSGEGEPLNNIKTFHEILRTSCGGRAFEFITSGFLPHAQLQRFFNETEAILSANGDMCNIRLSSDSYHVEKIRHRPHGFSLLYALEQKGSALTFSFRSVDTDRSFTRRYLLEEAAVCRRAARVDEVSVLEDRLFVDQCSFGIDYKNHVNPSEARGKDRLDLRAYIEAMEARIGKRFTLGSLNPAPMRNGLDVTIKPDGSVLFYGLENIPLGNIHRDRLTWHDLERHVSSTPLVRQLYTTPFLDVLSRIDGVESVSKLVGKTNNPYWLVKELAKDPLLLERMAAE